MSVSPLPTLSFPVPIPFSIALDGSKHSRNNKKGEREKKEEKGGGKPWCVCGLGKEKYRGFPTKKKVCLLFCCFTISQLISILPQTKFPKDLVLKK